MRLPLICLLVMPCLAEGPAGTLSSSAPFRLDGTQVAVAGVPRWPVMTGQRIENGEAPALMELAGGNRVWLLPRARVSLSRSGERVLVKVSEGGLAYRLSEDAVVEIGSEKGKRVPRESREGRLHLGSTEAWAPSEAMFYSLNQPRGINVFPSFRVTPFSTDFLNQWRQYNPPFGNAPGQTLPNSGLPPGQAVSTEPPPVSLFRP
ncbi:MAG: hypothetical protein FJW20_26295 [Acidimicrobiia bacterium]|nr:hypothetical protein [Acidimicrobiia bacterium]